MDAWLAFLSIDEPDMIIKLTEEYPEFKAMYQQVYEICRNMEGLMGIFSEELKIMDRNIVRYMVDQMQDELDEKQAELREKQEQLEVEHLRRREAEQRAEEAEEKLRQLLKTSK